MKKNYMFIAAVLALTVFTACGKKSNDVTEAPIAPGEFYIKATVNGVQHTYANDVDGYKLEANFSAGMDVSGIFVNARGAGFCQYIPNTGNRSYFLFQDSVADNITAMAGTNIPFCKFAPGGSFLGVQGVVLSIDKKSSW